MDKQFLAIRRQAKMPRGTVQQPHPEMGLKGRDLAGNGAWALVQHPRSGNERAFLRYTGKHCQRAQKVDEDSSSRRNNLLLSNRIISRRAGIISTLDDGGLVRLAAIKEKIMRTLHCAALAALAIGLTFSGAAPALAQTGSATDSLYYNLSGPGVVNMTRPMRHENTTSRVLPARRTVAGATVPLDPTLYSVANPGTVAQARPALVAASGYGAPVELASRPVHFQGPEGIDAETYNTAGPGELVALNPILHVGGLRSRSVQTAQR